MSCISSSKKTIKTKIPEDEIRQNKEKRQEPKPCDCFMF